MDIKKRLQNKAFILAVIAFIILVVKTFTKVEIPNNIDVIINTLISILVGLGILVDPTSDGISDK